MKQHLSEWTNDHSFSKKFLTLQELHVTKAADVHRKKYDRLRLEKKNRKRLEGCRCKYNLCLATTYFVLEHNIHKNLDGDSVRY